MNCWLGVVSKAHVKRGKKLDIAPIRPLLENFRLIAKAMQITL